MAAISSGARRLAISVRSEAAAGWCDEDGGHITADQRMRRADQRLAWIVCEHATRDVNEGLVPCPHGGRVAVSGCMDCHLLETLATERDPRLSCARSGSAVT